MSPVQLDWDFKTRATFTVLWSYFTLSYPHEPSLLYNDSMKIPKRIIPLVEDGVVDEVLRQLMSGFHSVVRRRNRRSGKHRWRGFGRRRGHARGRRIVRTRAIRFAIHCD